MPAIDPRTEANPKYAKIVASASGATEIVAAVGSGDTARKIRVVALSLMANGTVNAKFQSAATDLSGLDYLVGNGGKVLPYNECGWFETAPGEPLNINLSGSVAVGGHLTYIEAR
jgi:hypothetical protein